MSSHRSNGLIIDHSGIVVRIVYRDTSAKHVDSRVTNKVGLSFYYTNIIGEGTLHSGNFGRFDNRVKPPGT